METPYELRSISSGWKHPKRKICGWVRFKPLRHISFYSDDVRRYDKNLTEALCNGCDIDDWQSKNGQRPNKSLQYSPLFLKPDMQVMYKNDIPYSKRIRGRQL